MFRYAGLQYLRFWIERDRQIIARFAENPTLDDFTILLKAYGVARTLPVAIRQNIFISLMLMEPIARGQEIRTVVEMGQVTDPAHISAASKYLWIKFGAQVSIYDSLTKAGLGLNPNSSYKVFFCAWHNYANQNADQINEAIQWFPQSDYLARIAARHPAAQHEIKGLIQSDRFRNRVVDYALITLGKQQLGLNVIPIGAELALLFGADEVPDWPPAPSR